MQQPLLHHARKLCYGALLLFLCISCGKKNFNHSPSVIARDKNWTPAESNAEAPNFHAFVDALIYEIGKEEKTLLQLVSIDGVELFDSLERGEVEGILSALPPTIITEQKYAFSDPLVMLGPVLIVPYDSPANSLADLQGKTIAVSQFDDSVLIVQKYPSIVIQLYQNMSAVLDSLKKGEFDGVLMPTLDAHSFLCSLYQQQLRIASPPLNTKALRLVTLKGSDPTLLQHLNQGLKHLISTGKYQALRKKYQLA